MKSTVSETDWVKIVRTANLCPNLNPTSQTSKIQLVRLLVKLNIKAWQITNNLTQNRNKERKTHEIKTFLIIILEITKFKNYK